MKAIKHHVRKTFKMGGSYQEKTLESDGKTSSSLSQSDLSLNAEDFSFTSNSPRTVDTASTSDSLKLDSLSNGSVPRTAFRSTASPGDNQKLPLPVTSNQRMVSPPVHQQTVLHNNEKTLPSAANAESNHNGNNNYASPSEKSAVPAMQVDPQRPSPFDRLADDLIVHIFSHLSSKQLCRCSCVSRRWHHLVWQPSLWTTIQLSSRRTAMDQVLMVILGRLAQETPYVCLSVEKVILNNCGMLTDRGLELIANHCPELHHLELVGCHQINNSAVFQILTRCINLDYLDVSSCKRLICMNLPAKHAASDQNALIKQQINLRHLDMSDCPMLDDNALRTIAINCPTLVNLFLRRCVRLTDIGVQYVATQCLMLKEVSLSDCPFVTDNALWQLAKLEYHLRYLSVAKCEQITDLGIQAIANRCYKLRYLNIRGCVHISDKSLELLSRSCSRLRSLDVGKCPLVTDGGLIAIATNCPSLRKLSVKGCLHVTDDVFEVLAQVCPDLQQLNIQDCDEVSRKAYKLLKRCCRKCIIEHTNPAFY